MTFFSSLLSHTYAVAARRTERAYNHASNLVNAHGFNQRVLDEAARKASESFYEQPESDDVDGVDGMEWDIVSRGITPPGTIYANDEFTFRPKTGPSHRLRFRISRRTMRQLCEAANVSKEFASFALQFFVAELSSDVTWMAGCRTVTDVVRTVKFRYPLLEDLQRACGSMSASRVDCGDEDDTPAESGASGPSRLGILQLDENHIPINPNDLPVLAPELLRSILAQKRKQRLVISSQGAEIYDENVHGDVEVVLEGRNYVRDKTRLEPRMLIDEDGFHDLELND